MSARRKLKREQKKKEKSKSPKIKIPQGEIRSKIHRQNKVKKAPKKG